MMLEAVEGEEEMMEKKRSVGVLILCIIFIFLGIWHLFQLSVNFSYYILTMKEWKHCVANMYFGDLLFMHIIFILLAFISFGIFRLQSWARKATLSLSCIAALTNIIISGIVVHGGFVSSWIFLKYEIKVIVELLFPVILFSYFIYFFTRPKVKEQFSR